MNESFQALVETDIPKLLELMESFYAEQHMRFDRNAASNTLKQLLAYPGLGHVFLIFYGLELAGYFVLTYCFSIEFHGKFALLDELFILKSAQGRGIGKSVIAFSEDLCKRNGIHALRLEVGWNNEIAQRLYQKAGMIKDERYLYTKWLS